MKVEIEVDDAKMKVMSLREVAEQMMLGYLKQGERMGDIERDEDALNVAVVIDEPMDVRINGCTDRWETFGLADIARIVTDYAHLQWAKDEDGADILLCFNAN